MTMGRTRAAAPRLRTPAALVAHLRDRYSKGNLSALYAQRSEMQKTILSGSGPADAQAELRALLAFVALTFLDRDQAEFALAPFIKGSGATLDMKGGAIATACGGDPLLEGFVQLQVAQLLFRRRQFGEASRAAKVASEQLADGKSSAATIDVLRAAEAEIWLARVRSRRDRVVADDMLRATTNWLLQHKTNGSSGGVDLLIAHAASIHASLAWRRGHTDAARKHVYRSLFVLRNGAVRDDIGLAYALYIAARIESTFSQSGFEWPRRLLEQCKAIFHESRHPFLPRVLVQEVQCEFKAERFTHAEKLLGDFEKEFGSLLLRPRNGATETEHARGQALLTKLWMLERDAQDTRVGSDEWKACGPLADKLLRASVDGPSLLQLEAKLHDGIARLGVGDASGLQCVKDVARQAGSQERGHIYVKACFVLAQNLAANRADALEWFRLGDEFLQRRPSTHLGKQRAQLAAQLEAPLLMEVNVWEPYDVAIERCEVTYLTYHAEFLKKRTIRELADRVNVPPPTLGARMDRLKFKL
jgi:hypothetical protein